jgi:hypothetical protein
LPLLLALHGESLVRVALLAVVWTVCGWVSATAISRSMAALRPPEFPPPSDVEDRAEGMKVPVPAGNRSTAIREPAARADD